MSHRVVTAALIWSGSSNYDEDDGDSAILTDERLERVRQFVRRLIAAGYGINIEPAWTEQPPLLALVEEGRWSPGQTRELVAELLVLGADPNLMRGYDEKSVFDWAAERDDLELLNLLELYARPATWVRTLMTLVGRTSIDPAVFEYVAARVPDLNVLGPTKYAGLRGLGPVHVAAISGAVEDLRRLLGRSNAADVRTGPQPAPMSIPAPKPTGVGAWLTPQVPCPSGAPPSI